MQFLNLKLSTPETGEVKLYFSPGINIISAKNSGIYTLLTDIPLLLSSDRSSKAFNAYKKNFTCTLSVLSGGSEKNLEVTMLNGCLAVTEPECRESDDADAFYKYRLSDLSSTLNSDDIQVLSVYSPEAIQKNSDPVFNQGRIKSLFINNEVLKSGFPYFHSREVRLTEYERELTTLNREKQLLELQKMKKEKLLKEIQTAERGLVKLEKRKESILKYQDSLREINSKIESRTRTLSRINNLKKDIIELNAIREKISTVEETLKQRFSHFSEKGNEQIPDLEQIQSAFNSFRDLNEQLDRFSHRKKVYSDISKKIILSMLIFSVVAFLFYIFTSTASFALGLTSLFSAAAAVTSGIIYYFRVRPMHPAGLLEQKKMMENSLIELLKKNNFSVDDCKTGELYEILFQYFEDFINYRDISYELVELNKKISNSANLADKENRLKLLDEEINSIDDSIKDIIYNLDHSIHPEPEIENIDRVLHETDELLNENESGIDEKRSLILKFEEEIKQFEMVENSAMSLDVKLEDITGKIQTCRENIEHIKFLNSVFEEASANWSSGRLEELSGVTLEKFLKLTDNSFIRDDIADTINSIIVASGHIRPEHKGLKKYLAFAIKAALSEMLLNCSLPPVFMINPFTSDNEFAENMKKLLPELFHERQVVIIIPGNEPDLKGNLINL